MKEPTDRQTEIISAAFTLIANYGVQDLTIKNLGAAIGVSEPAIYRHFASKREILAGIVDRLAAIRNETWERSQGEKASPVAALQMFFIYQAIKFEEFPPLAIILFPEDIFRNDSELLTRIHHIMNETAHNIEDLIINAQKNNYFRPEIDSHTAALLLTGGYRALVSGWRSEHLRDPSVGLVERVEVFFRNTIQI